MIQTETTPNPNSLKFLSEKIISATGSEEFQKANIKDLSNPFIKELPGAQTLSFSSTLTDESSNISKPIYIY